MITKMPHEFVDLKTLNEKYEVKVNEPFVDENDAIEQLKEFQALLVMRERTRHFKLDQ